MDPLLKLFSLSLGNGFVPLVCHTVVMPFHNGGPTTYLRSYTPIILCLICKAMEWFIADLINDIINLNRLDSKQFGFVKGRSCPVNLKHFFERVT